MPARTPALQTITLHSIQRPGHIAVRPVTNATMRERRNKGKPLSEERVPSTVHRIKTCLVTTAVSLAHGVEMKGYLCVKGRGWSVLVCGGKVRKRALISAPSPGQT